MTKSCTKYLLKKKLLHWIELLCNDVICIKLGNETEKLGPHWTLFFMCMFFNCPSLLYSLTKKCCKQNNSIYDIANAWGAPTIQSVLAAWQCKRIGPQGSSLSWTSVTNSNHLMAKIELLRLINGTFSKHLNFEVGNTDVLLQTDRFLPLKN